jgi:hypothetical protein
MVHDELGVVEDTHINPWLAGVQVGLSFVAGGLIPTIPELLSPTSEMVVVWTDDSDGGGGVSDQSPLYAPASSVGWSGISRRRHRRNSGWGGFWLAPAWRVSLTVVHLPSRVLVALWLDSSATALHQASSSF